MVAGAYGRSINLTSSYEGLNLFKGNNMKIGGTYGHDVELQRGANFGNEVVIVDGQGRSGKNLIAVLLSTMNRVEKMRLDSQIDYFVRYYFLGKMSLDAAVIALQLEFDEKYYYQAISRDANFRIADYTGVLKQGKRLEYFRRLFLPADEAAVTRMQKEKGIFQEMTHDGLHAASLYFAALGERLKMVHIFRDPVGNIYEQNERDFGTRIGSDPRELQLTHLWNGHHVPIMVIGKEEAWLEGNATERLVLIVDAMFRLNLQGYLDISPDDRKRILFLEFEDFVVNPYPHMERLEAFIGEKFGKEKTRILKRERSPRVLDPLERQRRIDTIRQNIGNFYDNIFLKLIEDYDKKPWLEWDKTTELNHKS